MENESKVLGQLSFGREMAERVEKWRKYIPAHLRDQFDLDLMQWPTLEFNTAINVLERHMTEKEWQSGHDKLTKLANRDRFETHLITVLEKSPEELPRITALGVIFIDLNRFKEINDKLGHETGDEAIRATAAVIQETIRTSRTVDVYKRIQARRDVADSSRWGGDEFLAAIELGKPEDISKVARRLKRAIDDPVKQKQHGYSGELPYTAALGALAFLLHRPEQKMLASNKVAASLIRQADKLMYASKGDGQVHIRYAYVMPNMDANPPEVEVELFEALP